MARPNAASDTYTHGHDAAVLRSHTARTVDNSTAYLVPFLEPGRSLLDVGCGPGTPTADLARLVAPGRAGFTDVTLTSRTWVFATPDERVWWSEVWAGRTSTASGFGRQAVDYGLATQADLDAIAGAWRRWAALDDACFFVPHGEVIARP